MELKPGIGWLKTNLLKFNEDKTVRITLGNLLMFYVPEGGVPTADVRPEQLRQNPAPAAAEQSTLEELRARRAERRTCVFHEANPRCNCFHCKRLLQLDQLIREAEERRQ